MLTINDLKLGTFFKYENEPYLVQYRQHVKLGRGGGQLKTKIKNLLKGNVLEKTFKAGDKFEEIKIEKKRANFLYQDNENLHLMDLENYEQFSLPSSQVADKTQYLKEGGEVEIIGFDGQPLLLELPKKIELKVIAAPPGLRGNTSQGRVFKLVTLETGLEINVPLFIKEGDIIRVNTETGEYVERV